MQEQLGGGRHQQDYIISPEGVCKALTAGSHLNADWMTLIYEEYGTQDDEREDIQDCWKQPEEPIQG